MNPNPFVSVIIPAYNQAQFLPNAIRSVLEQTYQNFEIIIVDDGSVDDTKEIVGQYKDRLNYIWQENRGLAGARNTGILAAKGKYIGLLDSDDCWLPTYLDEMVSLATRIPEAAVYYCSAQGVDIDGNPLPQVFGGPAQHSQTIYQTLVRANFLIPSTILMKRSIGDKTILFDENLRSCEDWDLWLRLLPDHTIEGLNQILVNYRIHTDSLSTDPSGMQRAARMVVEKHFGSDDGRVFEWSDLKKRAYGGLYFYHAWTTILRQGDWESGGRYLLKALLADKELISNLDIYYEIILGRQPVGFRGTNQFLDLSENLTNLENIFKQIGSSPSGTGLGLHLNRMLGTAYYAAGLLAYNTNNNFLCRKYLALALKFRYDLWADSRIFKIFLRSLLPLSIFSRLKSAKSILPENAH